MTPDNKAEPSIIDSVIEGFLCSDKREVLAIKGEWGVGKTYRWKEAVKKAREAQKIALKKYSYVSLFGISSIDDLKMQIVFNSYVTWGEKNNSGPTLMQQGKEIIKNIPYLGKMTASIDVLAPLMIKDMIICLDDFERLSEKIAPEELLGFISDLKDEKNCKIALIFNAKKLSDPAKKAYQTYREKVIDKEIIYAPSAQESLEIIFAHHPDKAEIYKQCMRLGITNIRVLRKIETLIDETLKPEVEKAALPPLIYEMTIQSSILATTSFYNPNEKIPSIDELERNHDPLAIPKLNNEEEKKKEREKIRAYLDLFENKYYLTSLDFSIIEVVKRGFTEGTGFAEVLKKIKKDDAAEGKKDNLYKIWISFYASFDDNQDELINTLETKIKDKEFLPVVDINFLNTIAEAFIHLGEEKRAQDLIDYYFENNRDQLPEEDPTRWGTGRISNLYLQIKLEEHFKKTRPTPTLRETLMHAYINSNLASYHSKCLKQASEDDFYSLFKEEKSVDLPRLAKGALIFDESKEKAKKALARIAKENPFNAYKIKNIYAISLPEDDAEKPASP